MRSVDLKEFVTGFVAEADDHLRSIRSELLELDSATQQGRSSPRAVRELFRSFHTIKGLAAMVGVEPIADLAHSVETVLRNADRGGGRLGTAALELVISSVQAIERRLKSVSTGAPVDEAPQTLIQALAELQAPDAGATAAGTMPLLIEPELERKLMPSEREQLRQGVAEGRRALRVEFVPTPERAAMGLNITRVREQIGQCADIVRVIPVAVPKEQGTPGGLKFVLLLVSAASNEQIAEALGGEPTSVTEVLERRPTSPPSGLPEADVPEDDGDLESWRGRVVRVDVDRLDDALEHLSVLVVSRHRLDRVAQDLTTRGADTRELAQALIEQGRELRRLRAAILRLRLIDVGEMLDPLPLLLRGLKAATGKAVRLEIERTNAELDKAVSERVLPAIVHLIRNAVDHAIEAPEERRAIGKAEEGTIRISCRQRTESELEIVVADDGRGIDRELIAQRAGCAVPQTDAELLAILARPGFSTRDQVTKTSGRGVGVDIVRKIVVGELGGGLSLDTSPGHGSTFTLRIPLTMTIADVFAFEAALQTFVVPVSMIDEIIEVEPSALRSAPAPDHGGIAISLIERRGLVLPIVALTDALGIGRVGQRGYAKALVVRAEEETIAFGVDRMLGQKEVVVRPLLDPLVHVGGVGGSTDLGDGRPVLVLDLLALSRAVLGHGKEAA